MPNITGISAIIPHYGNPDFALKIVEKLKQQVDAPPLEIIVSDDCSPQPFPEVEGVSLVRRKVNGGFGSAVNTGVAIAKYSHLLILNSDLLPEPSFIHDLAEAAEPLQPAVVAPALISQQGAYQWTGRKFPTNAGYFFEWLTVLARFRNSSWWHRLVGHDVKCVPGVLHKTDWVVGAAMLVPTAIFREVGGFDESFFMYCEEIDLQRRLSQKGIGSYVAGVVSIVHIGGESTDPTKARTWMMRSRLLFSAKWGDRPRILKLALTLASYLNFLWNCQRQLRGKKVNARAVLRKELNLLKG